MLNIITVNYNCAEKTLALLKSLELQTAARFSVTVVDNDSVPDDRALLGEYAASSPLPLDFIASDRNRGFSGGNNVAIRKAIAAGADWIVLLNPDTTVAPDFVAVLHAALAAQPAGVVGLPLREGGKTVYGGIPRWFRYTLTHSVDLPSSLNRFPVRYAIGAAMAVHRDVVERIGLLDGRFFLYFEDAEYSLRASRAGFPVTIVERPLVTHAVSQSTRSLGAPLLLRYHARNALLFNRLCGPWWVRGTLPFWAFFSSVRQLIKAVLMPSRRPQARAIRDGISDYYAGRFGQLSP